MKLKEEQRQALQSVLDSAAADVRSVAAQLDESDQQVLGDVAEAMADELNQLAGLSISTTTSDSTAKPS